MVEMEHLSECAWLWVVLWARDDTAPGDTFIFFDLDLDLFWYLFWYLL